MTDFGLEYNRFYKPNEYVMSWDYANSKYPSSVKELTIDMAKGYLNTKVRFEVFDYSDKGEPLCYNVVIDDSNVKQGEHKYVGLTQQLLESIPVIELNDQDNTITLGYIKCDIVGYVSLPYRIYVLRIIE